MHAQQREIVLFSLTLLSLLITTAHSHSPSSSPSAPPSDGADYIRTICSTTLHPDICFTSLSRYATNVNHDPTRLAHTALVVALSSTRGAASYISTLSDPSSAVVLLDCVSLLQDASSRISKSLRRMKQMAAAGSRSEKFTYWVSDVQTWMTAASTYDATCTDGFDDLESSRSGLGPGSAKVKEEVSRRVDEVKKITSNALALFLKTYSPN